MRCETSKRRFDVDELWLTKPVNNYEMSSNAVRLQVGRLWVSGYVSAPSMSFASERGNERGLRVQGPCCAMMMMVPKPPPPTHSLSEPIVPMMIFRVILLTRTKLSDLSLG